MKKFWDEILYAFLRLFGEAFADRKMRPKNLLKAVFWQKFLHINNGHVPWPVHRTSVVSAPQNIQRGTRFPGLSVGCYLDGRNGIIFGKNVWVGPNVSIISMNHDIHDYKKYIVGDPIIIGDNCWLATGCTILPSVKLGNHVVVAAGAVVTKSFEEDNIVLGGVPAKIIKRIGSYCENYEDEK